VVFSLLLMVGFSFGIGFAFGHSDNTARKIRHTLERSSVRQFWL
jgi:hypothetical protein